MITKRSSTKPSSLSGSGSEETSPLTSHKKNKSSSGTKHSASITSKRVLFSVVILGLTVLLIYYLIILFKSGGTSFFEKTNEPSILIHQEDDTQSGVVGGGAKEQAEKHLPNLHEQKDFYLKEKFITSGSSIENNLDSLQIYHDGQNNDWIIATSKASNSLFLFDAHNGQLLKQIKSESMLRPNGVFLFPTLNNQPPSLVAVVERDGHKVQILSLPSFQPVYTFGQNVLKRPYGLAIQSLSMNQNDKETKVRTEKYRIFVTDNFMEQQYDAVKGKMSFSKLPPIDELDGRVKVFLATVEINSENDNAVRVASVQYERNFGENEVGDRGVLKVVESIVVDPQYNRLLIADEHESSWDVKIYDLDTLRFSGDTLGNKMDETQLMKFNAEPEGIALYACSLTEGYYIFTEQLLSLTRFHVLNRRDFKYLGTFTGHVTRKTDGIAVTNQSFGEYKGGMFVAIHDDSSVSAWKWSDIADALGLSCAPH